VRRPHDDGLPSHHPMQLRMLSTRRVSSLNGKAPTPARMDTSMCLVFTDMALPLGNALAMILVEDGGCKKMDEDTVPPQNRCSDALGNPQDQGLVVVVESEGNSLTQYCCSSGIEATEITTTGISSSSSDAEDATSNRKLFEQTGFFTGWESFNTGSDGFKYVFDLFLHGVATGKCIGPDISRFDNSGECFGLGGHIVEAFESNHSWNDTGYCCPPFDVSKLEDGGCDKTENGSFVGTQMDCSLWLKTMVQQLLSTAASVEFNQPRACQCDLSDTLTCS
jgi:hypothetical protein